MIDVLCGYSFLRIFRIEISFSLSACFCSECPHRIPYGNVRLMGRMMAFSCVLSAVLSLDHKSLFKNLTQSSPSTQTEDMLDCVAAVACVVMGFGETRRLAYPPLAWEQLVASH